MAADKNLFLYDLAIVAIMKNEGHYVKEWLDYHLLAGVNHFYIYDHESPDNLKEVLQPYVERGIVTYIFCPNEQKQVEVYLEAVQKYKFFCRYMSFVDGDEFIFPQSNKSIVEVTDEILQDKPPAAGLVVQWQMYGSNNLETADYSKGVLERFTRRAATLLNTIKTIANPRRINYMFTPHYMVYFDGFYQIDENSLHFFPNNDYKISDKIIMNHYRLKSREEFERKEPRGSAAYGKSEVHNKNNFTHEENNDVFDNSILKYRAARFQQTGGGIVKLVDYQKSYTALIENLAPTLKLNAPREFFQGKMETFLICRALAENLREKLIDEKTAKFFEEAALNAIYKTLFTNIAVADIKLLLSEFPNLLQLDYPVVKNIAETCIKILQQIKDTVRNLITDEKTMTRWKEFAEYDYLIRMLQTFKFQ